MYGGWGSVCKRRCIIFKGLLYSSPRLIPHHYIMLCTVRMVGKLGYINLYNIADTDRWQINRTKKSVLIRSQNNNFVVPSEIMLIQLRSCYCKGHSIRFTTFPLEPCGWGSHPGIDHSLLFNHRIKMINQKTLYTVPG